MWLSETTLLFFRVQGCHKTFPCWTPGRTRLKVANPLPRSEMTLELECGRSRRNQAGVNTNSLLRSTFSLRNAGLSVTSPTSVPQLVKCCTHQLFGVSEFREIKLWNPTEDKPLCLHLWWPGWLEWPHTTATGKWLLLFSWSFESSK